MTESEARVQIEAFKASVPGVERWRKKLIETASRRRRRAWRRFAAGEEFFRRWHPQL